MAGARPPSNGDPSIDDEPVTPRQAAQEDDAVEPGIWMGSPRGVVQTPPVEDASGALVPAPRPVASSSYGGGEPEEEISEDSAIDIAPVGPTEWATGPESMAAPTRRQEPAEAPQASVEQLAQQIRDLEARLDEMIATGAREPSQRPGTEAGAREPGSEEPPPASGRSAGRATARDLLPEEYYLRQWGRAGRRKRAEEVDDFGHDPKYEARFQPFFDFLYKIYFRVEATGVENIPAEGRCLVVANHSGGPLPYDGIMLRTTVRQEQQARIAEGVETLLKAPRELRWLAEDFVYYLPFVGTAMNRLGAVRACQENAERLLAQDNLVAVFPEGAKGIGKLFRERYKLQRFGRGGFIRLCLRTQTPIVPAAIVGAEEANPMLYRIEYMTKALGIPYLPITPTFPALGPVGLLPAPTKWKVTFGEPIDFHAYGPEAADDDLLVGRLAERVRTTIQGMLDHTLERRRSVWFG
jgi:1-acyl-sn-glycerol-3-phosphate acyltransferase